MFQCDCSPGWEGEFCETRNTSPCSLNPCLNGGTCNTKTDLSYYCTCAPGYSGTLCDKPDLCLPNPCKDGYVCEEFPPQAPTQYMCCEENRAICYSADGCPKECEMTKNDDICQVRILVEDEGYFIKLRKEW